MRNIITSTYRRIYTPNGYIEIALMNGSRYRNTTYWMQYAVSVYVGGLRESVTYLSDYQEALELANSLFTLSSLDHQ